MEKISKFDLNSAFKALNELEIPEAERVSDRKELNEVFIRPTNKTDSLIEDYYNVTDPVELEAAADERAEEVAQAKLDKIEKIVDLDAKSPEDLQPSYVGKTIIQCPQCLTLFYKDEKDIEPSEDDPKVVNINEPCQHCGNISGYDLIGKVADATPVEEAPVEEQPAEENELDLNFEEPVEEPLNEFPEENMEEEKPTEEEQKLEPVEEPEEEKKEEEKPEEEEEEKKEESLEIQTETVLTEEIKQEEITEEIIPEEEHKEEICPDCGKNPCECKKEEKCEECKESLEEDLDSDMKKYNDYVNYLQAMLKQDEEALEEAKKMKDNEFAIKVIEKRIAADKEDLEAAIPNLVKEKQNEEELPTPEEAGVEEPTKNESLTEATASDLFVELKKEDKFKDIPDSLIKKIISLYKEDSFDDKPLKNATAKEIVDWVGDFEDFLELYGDDLGMKAARDIAKADKKIIAKCRKAYEKTFKDDEDFDPKFSDAEAVDWIFEYDIDKKEQMPVANALDSIKESLNESVKDELDAFAASLDNEEVKESIEDEEKFAEFEQEIKNEELKEDKEDLALTDIDVPEANQANFSKMLNSKVFKEFGESCESCEKENKVITEDTEEEKANPLPTSIEQAGEQIGDKLQALTDAAKEEVKEIEDEKKEESFNGIEELHEKSFNEHITNYLTEVYSNVKNFEATSCFIKDDKIIIEGIINFNSGNKQDTKFEFVKADNNILEGLNESFSKEKAFKLNYFTEAGGTVLMTKDINYSYKINDTLVEGLK